MTAKILRIANIYMISVVVLLTLIILIREIWALAGDADSLYRMQVGIQCLIPVLFIVFYLMGVYYSEMEALIILKWNFTHYIQTIICVCFIGGDRPCSWMWKKQTSMKWVTVCKGGLLYDIRMLSKTGDDNDVAYGSFAEYGGMARDAGVPDGYPVFAALDTGDFLCFHYDDAANACGPKVFQWDGENSAFVLERESFDAWLSEQVCTAMKMIAEGDLEPVPFKAEEDG